MLLKWKQWNEIDIDRPFVDPRNDNDRIATEKMYLKSCETYLKNVVLCKGEITYELKRLWLPSVFLIDYIYLTFYMF